MEQPFGQVLGVAAVALVQPHDIHPTRERLGGEPAHVMRVARPVQAVQRDERRALPPVRLPVAIGGDARAGRDVEVAPHRRRQPRKIARVPPAVERHAVAAQQRPARLETVHAFDDSEADWGLGIGDWG